MSPVARIMGLSTAFGALLGGGLTFFIASGLFWGGLIGGALTGAAIGVVFVMLAASESEE